MKKIILLLFILLTGHIKILAQDFTLPIPQGEFKTGTTNFFLQDVYREEIFTEDPDDFRQFMVRAWYPVDERVSNTKLKYLEGYNIDTLKYFWDMFGIPEKLFDLIGKVETNSFIDAPISDSQNKFPVIIFSHGYGLGIPELYTFISENLASNGYIVLSLTHPYESVEIDYPDRPAAYVSERASEMLQENLMQYGALKNAANQEEKVKATELVLKNSKIAMESIEVWAKDSEFVLNQLSSSSSNIPQFIKDKADLDNIGALGHSFGGATAGELAMNDSRIKAVMNLDGFQYGSLFGKELNVPYAMVYSDFNKQMNDAILTTSSKDLYFITIPETMHFSFSDMPAYPDAFDKKAFAGTMESDLFINLLNELISSYFNKYLKDSEIEFPSDVFMTNYSVDIKTLRK
jgi:predicted dienelactone hydrolase